MDTFGNDLSSGGVVLSRDELIKKRQRSGECPTCGQKCFKKKLFKLEPITLDGKVLNGRCLVCNPQDPNKEELVASCAPVVSAPTNNRRPRSGSREARAHASSMPGNARGKQRSKLKTIQSERLKSTNEESSERAASSSSRSRHKSNGSSSGGGGSSSQKNPNRRKSLEKRDSEHNANFLQRKTPRPSAVFLDGINVDDIDDGGGSSDDDNNNRTRSAAGSASGSGGNKWKTAKSAVSRLTSEERQALRALNTDQNSFLDIVNIMMMNSMSFAVQAEGLHALSLVHDLDVGMLEDVANSCGFEVIVSAMGKCCKVRFNLYLYLFLC